MSGDFFLFLNEFNIIIIPRVRHAEESDDAYDELKEESMMITWKNLGYACSISGTCQCKKVNLKEAMTGENGADRVKKYSVPMAEGLTYHFAAKQVDDNILAVLKKLAEEAQLTEKFAALYNGEVDQYRRKTSGSSSADQRTAWRQSDGRRRG